MGHNHPYFNFRNNKEGNITFRERWGQILWIYAQLVLGYFVRKPSCSAIKMCKRSSKFDHLVVPFLLSTVFEHFLLDVIAHNVTLYRTVGTRPYLLLKLEVWNCLKCGRVDVLAIRTLKVKSRLTERVPKICCIINKTCVIQYSNHTYTFTRYL